MANTSLADLLGVRTKSIHWERPQLFFAALFVSDLTWLLIEPIYKWLGAVASGESSRFEPVPPINWLNNIIINLLLVALAVLAFRLLPNAIPALIAMAVVYAPLSGIISYITYNISYNTRFSFTLTILDYFRPQRLLFSGLWAFLFVGGLALAARWIKPLWLSLFAGALSGTIAHFTIVLVVNRLKYGNDEYFSLISQLTKTLPFRLLGAALFALSLWAGLRLTAGRNLSSEPGKARLTKGFYLGATMISLGVSLALIFSILTSLILNERYRFSPVEMNEIIGPILFIVLISLFGQVVFMSLTYKMWKAIQDGYARTTPGQAVGFLFVPFFNLYWIFQAYQGFANDFNNFIRRHSINAAILPAGLFTAYGVLIICSAIPFIGLLCAAANFIVMLVMISAICDAVNSIPEKLPGQDAEWPLFKTG